MSTPILFDVQPLDEMCELLSEVVSRMDVLAMRAKPSFKREHFPMVPVSDYGRLILWTDEIQGQAKDIAEYAAQIALVDVYREDDRAA